MDNIVSNVVAVIIVGLILGVVSYFIAAKLLGEKIALGVAFGGFILGMVAMIAYLA